MKLQQADLYRSSLLLFSLLLLAFFSGSCSLIAQDLQREQVSARQYCDFLNHEAVSDSGFFYDEAMSTDPETASILRTGTPGSYHYEVIAGRENFPITYVNAYAQSAFCNEQGFSDDDDSSNEDAFLKSNRIDFYAAVSAAPNQESLVPVADAVAAVTSYTPYIAATFATFFGVIFSRCSRSDAEGTPSERVNPDSSDGLGHSLLETHTESSSTYHPPVPLDVPNMDPRLTLGHSSTHSSREKLSEAAEETKSVASGNMEKEASLDSELDHRDLNFEEVAEEEARASLGRIPNKAPLPGIVEGDETASPVSPSPGNRPPVDPSIVQVQSNLSQAFEGAGNEYKNLSDVGEANEILRQNSNGQRRKSEGSVKSIESKGSISSRASKLSDKITNDPYSGIGRKFRKNSKPSSQGKKTKEATEE